MPSSPSNPSMLIRPVGVQVGGYTIQAPIDRGGGGAVYRAMAAEPEKHVVALKETRDPLHRDRFAEEFELFQRLHHPHLPAYEAYFEEDGRGYLVMEWVPGENLRTLVETRGTPLSEVHMLGYMQQLCSAVQYLHAQTPPVLHRDIKPANIRVTPSGQVKLVDFGLFKVGDASVASQRLGWSAQFAPPEQMHSALHTDQRSDIYSLAATAYYLVTRVKPGLPATPPSQIVADLSPACEAALLKALHPDPDERFPSVRDFFQALEADHPVPPAGFDQGATIQLRRERRCDACDMLNPPGMLFCQQCAHTLYAADACGRCRHPNPHGARFCGGCGESLAASAGPR